MRVEAFEKLRMQSIWERVVDYEFSDAGVHPLAVMDLLENEEEKRDLLEAPLGYPHADGTPQLRSRVAATYTNASKENVFVTNGSSEANFVAAWSLFEEGDEVVVMVPSYLQAWYLAKTWGLKVRALWLKEELGWQFDPEDLKGIVTKKTKAIQVCNPNNPTGAIMAPDQRRALLDISEDCDAWLLSDEVFIGAEREASMTESLWGRHEKTLVTNGLSKAYGLPGLRIGWLLGSPEALDAVKPHHDYLTLTPAALSDRLATLALEPRRRERILSRTRSIIRQNYPMIREWIESHGQVFRHVAPAAGAFCYVGYDLEVGSTELAERLRKEKSVLVVPGEQFEMGKYMRISMGPPRDYLLGGLSRIDELLRDIQSV